MNFGSIDVSHPEKISCIRYTTLADYLIKNITYYHDKTCITSNIIHSQCYQIQSPGSERMCEMKTKMIFSVPVGFVNTFIRSFSIAPRTISLKVTHSVLLLLRLKTVWNYMGIIIFKWN